MTNRLVNPKVLAELCGCLILVAALRICHAEAPSPAATIAYDATVRAVELRLSHQHQSAVAFFDATSQVEARARSGEIVIEQLTPATGVELPGAMLHHWRGTAFIAGARVEDFERLMKNFNAYPKLFSPEVEQGRVLSQQGDHFVASMRVRQKHVLTVVMDTTYDVTFRHLDSQHGYSLSRSMKISEIDSPDTSKERALSVSESHGFLWRQNTYWTYEERDGGLYMQIESISLSRSIPTGLGWVVRPFVESVPRESMEFTLRSTCNTLRK